MPTSNETRVRVDGFSKISAIERPESACVCEEASAFRSAASSRISGSSADGEVVDAQVVAHRRSLWDSTRRAIEAHVRSSAPSSDRSRSTIVRDERFDLLVREGAVGGSELEREREALAPVGDGTASEDVEEQRAVQ